MFKYSYPSSPRVPAVKITISPIYQPKKGSFRKPNAAQKVNDGKCDCAYCNLQAKSSQKSSSTTARKASKLVGNPKYKVQSLQVEETTPPNIGNGSVKIEKKTPVESNLEKIVPAKPGPKGFSLTREVELAASPAPNPPEKRHKCVCGNSYTRADHLKRHVKYSCEAVRAASLKTVAAAPEPSKIKCECGEGFDCVYNLVRHKTSCTWRKTNAKPFKCECGSAFDKYETMANHQKTDCASKKSEEGFSCGCGNSFSSYSVFLKHRPSCSLVNVSKKTISKDLPYPCVCGRKFARMCDLSRHKTVCDFWNSDQNELKTPAEVKKEEEEEEEGANDGSANGKSDGSFSCGCGEAFTTRTALFSHQNQSCSLKSQTQQHECVCGKTFLMACHLKRHQMCNVGCSVTNKPDEQADVKFECICGLAFPRAFQLTRHHRSCEVANAAGDVGKRVKCGCGRTFSRADAMVHHQKTACILRREGPSKGESATSSSKAKPKKSVLRCKCGAKFASPFSLKRHNQRSCTAAKGKAKAAVQVKRKYERKVHIRGSKVIHSKNWGIIRGPPFVCKCKASYLNYVSYCFHRRTTCPLNKQGIGETSKPQNTKKDDSRPTYQPIRKNGDPVNANVIFTCSCGQNFSSKLSRAGHQKTCLGHLSSKQFSEKCSICKATFSNRVHLVRHVKSVHCGVSNIKVGAKVKKITAKSPKSKARPRPPQPEGLVIESVCSLAKSS